MTRLPRLGLSVLLGLLLAAPLLAQNDPKLTYFYGGQLSIDGAFASQLATGPGVNGVVVSSAASARPDPFVAFGNPANMRHIRNKPSVGITLQPQLSLDLPSGLQDGVDEAMDEFIKEFEYNPSDVVYPQAGGTLTRSANSLSGFGMAIPAGKWRFGLGYSRPFYLDMQVNLGGFSQRIDQEEADPAESIAFAIQSRMSLNLNARADRWVAGVSREFGRLSLGLSVARTYMEVDINGGYNVDGIMTRGTQQYAFNDPSDPWYNQFGGVMRGGYTGSMYTYRGGIVYTAGGREETGWRIGMDVAINTGHTLHGGMELKIDEFLALELQPEEGEESFDVNRIEDVTEITRTYPNEYRPADEMELNTPNSVSLAFAKPGGWRPNLTFTYCFGNNLGYSLDVAEKRVTDDEYETRTYARGLTPNYGFYLGFNPGIFFFGTGATFATDLVDGYVDGNGVDIKGETDLLVPRLDLGMSFNLSSHLRYEMLIAGLPEDALRIGLVYDF